MNRLLAIPLIVCTACSGDESPQARPSLNSHNQAIVVKKAPPHRLLSSMPAKRILTIHAPNLKTAWRDFQHTAYRAFELDPEAMLSWAQKNYDAGLPPARPGGAGGPPPWSDIETVLRGFTGEFVLSLIDLNPESRRPDVEFLCAIEIMDVSKQASDLLNRVVAMANSMSGFGLEKVRGIWNGSVAGMQFQVAVDSNALWVGFGENTVESALMRLVGDEAARKGAMKSPAFDAADAVRIQFDIAQCFDRFGGKMPAVARKIVEGLGLNHLSAFNLAMRVAGEDIIATTDLASPGGKDIFTRYAREHPVTYDVLSQAPAGTTSVLLFTLDLPWLLENIRSVLPDEVAADFNAGLATGKARGLDLEGDILPALGSQFAIIGLTEQDYPDELPGLARMYLDSAVLMQVSDEKRVRDLLWMIPISPSDARARRLKINDVDVVTYEMDSLARMPVELSPSWAIHNGFLLFTLRMDAMRELLGHGSKATAEKLRKELAEVPAGACAASIDRSQRASIVSDSLNRLMQVQLSDHASTLKPKVDEFDRLLAGASPAITYSTAHENGITSYGRSPSGEAAGVNGIAVTGIVASIAIPNLLSARLNANESAAIATMKNISSAQNQYQASGLKDGNNNGCGEFAFFGELVDPQSGPPMLSQSFAPIDGLTSRSGYYYRIYLSGKKGLPIADGDTGIDASHSEVLWVAVAWPTSQGNTGNRAFMVCQDGDIYACVDGQYSGDNGPAPDLLNRKKGRLDSPPLRAGATTRDGTHWILVN